MDIKVTADNKVPYLLRSIKAGDQVKLEYINSEGKKMFYIIKVTNNEKLVMN